MLSPPVSQEHFFWLCKAICYRVWKRNIAHKSNAVVRPNDIHLITTDVVNDQHEQLPRLAVTMLWMDTHTASEARDSIGVTIKSAQGLRNSFDRHVIFMPRQFVGELAPNWEPSPNISTKVQILTWHKIEAIVLPHRSLLLSYVAAGVKIEPRSFSLSPQREETRAELPPHRPYRIKRPRPSEPTRDKFFSFTTLASFERLVAAQYPNAKKVRLISAKNHESRGYAIAAIWSCGLDPAPLIDLWLLTAREEDTQKLLGLSPGNVVNENSLDFFSLQWIRYACAEKIKRELAREIHTSYKENIPESGDRHCHIRLASLRVKFIFFDTQNELPLHSLFPSKFPTVVLSWDVLFPGENRDDFYILADVERTITQLIVKQWKFVHGIEIEHEYRIALNRISETLASYIQKLRSFDGTIPHTHEVRIDSVQTFCRLKDADVNRGKKLSRATSLESFQCIDCESTFLRLLRTHEKRCAKCDLHFGTS